MALDKARKSLLKNSQAPDKVSQFASKNFGIQRQKAAPQHKSQHQVEDDAFQEQKFEATGLQLQAKYGTITPEGQERLGILQAKMDGLLHSRLERASQFGHNIANISLKRPNTQLPIQAKLTIGEPGDKFEQEADKTAPQVVQRIHQPQTQKFQQPKIPYKRLQMQPTVQRVSEGGVATTSDLEASIQQTRGSGQPLAQSIKEPMEQAFGTDFSGVRVHTDSHSNELNRSIQAKAFTTGQNVFFRQGAYEPESRGGQELIAHELTHVIQQNGGQNSDSTTVQSQSNESVNNPLQISRSSVDTIQRAVGLEIEIPVPVDNLASSDVQGIQDKVTELHDVQNEEDTAISDLTKYVGKRDQSKFLKHLWYKQKVKKTGKKLGAKGQERASLKQDIATTIGTKGKAKYGTIVHDKTNQFRLDVDHDDRVKNSSDWPPREGGDDSLLEIVMDPPAQTRKEFKDTMDAIEDIVNKIDTATNGLTKREEYPGVDLINGVGPLTYDEDVSYTKKDRHNYKGSIQANVGIDLRQYNQLIDWYAQDQISDAPDSATDKEKGMYAQIKVDMAKAVDIAQKITAKFMSIANTPQKRKAAGNFKGLEGWVTHMALYMQRGAAKDLRGTIKNVVPVLLKTPNEIASHYGMTGAEKNWFRGSRKGIIDNILDEIGRPEDKGKPLDQILIFPEKTKELGDSAAYNVESLTDLDSKDVMLAGKPIDKPTGVGKKRTGEAVSELPEVPSGEIGGGKNTRGGMVVEFRNIPGLHEGVDSWRKLGLQFFDKAEELNKKPGT
ncbi:MAG: DUF4157 domain-containing protein [Desmonostoc vinosum HA7617-LM4]|jgi:hypothetical protein|nr:DUF4157 domain-containing protein [Desmonostoc vinosum HA7617-LM4]